MSTAHLSAVCFAILAVGFHGWARAAMIALMVLAVGVSLVQETETETPGLEPLPWLTDTPDTTSPTVSS